MAVVRLVLVLVELVEWIELLNWLLLQLLLVGVLRALQLGLHVEFLHLAPLAQLGRGARSRVGEDECWGCCELLFGDESACCFYTYLYTLVDTLTSLDGLHGPCDAAPPCAIRPNAVDDNCACKALFSGVFQRQVSCQARDN